MNVKKYTYNFNVDIISVIFISLAEICFYKSDSIKIYWILSFVGMIIIFIKSLKYFSTVIPKHSLTLWLIAVYCMYFFYGFFCIKKGVFVWYTLFYRLLESIALYIATKRIVNNYNPETLIIPFVISGIISAFYLFLLESQQIISGNARIGGSLSGNVNTVGFIFGLISLLTMWWYCQNKKIIRIILFLLFSFVLLLTGSKKAFMILAIDMLVFFYYQRNQLTRWLKIFAIALFTIYIVFKIPYFYNIIGIRLESMMFTLIGGPQSNFYSYSTDVRNEMIIEGFKIFKNNPLIGGGWNNFYANSIYGYDYSHCNYIEMLCSFGIIGTLVFYSKCFYNIKLLFKTLKSSDSLDCPILAASLIAIELILDWGAVTFSAQCVWYLPIVISSVLIEYVQK